MLRFGIEEETNKKEPKNEQFLIEIFFFFLILNTGLIKFL